MLATTDEAPSEKTTPKKIEMPLKAADSDPGMYGYATTAAKPITAMRTMR